MWLAFKLVAGAAVAFLVYVYWLGRGRPKLSAFLTWRVAVLGACAGALLLLPLLPDRPVSPLRRYLNQLELDLSHAEILCQHASLLESQGDHAKIAQEVHPDLLDIAVRVAQRPIPLLQSDVERQAFSQAVKVVLHFQQVCVPQPDLTALVDLNQLSR